MGTALVVRVLGEVTVLRPDGTEIRDWTRPTGKRLLCLVLLAPGRTVTRSDAASALFPLAGARAGNSLAKAVHWCRQALGEALGRLLVSEGGTIRWTGDVLVDADPALALARAGPERLARFDPSVLRDLSNDERPLLPGSDADWVEPFRAELTAGRVLAAAALATILEAGGAEDLNEASHLWQRLVTIDALSEEHHWGLLRTLAAQGRATEARAAYVRYRKVLWTELGVTPSAALESWWRDRAGAWADAEMPTTVVSAARPERVTTPDATQLVGREAELAELVRRLEPTTDGRGRTVTLTGAPGVGKTELIRALADVWRSRGWVVAGGAATSVAGPAYSAVAKALTSLLGDAGAEALASPLRPGHVPGVPPTRQERSDSALHSQIVARLDAAVSVPTLLIVDDVHEADPASIRLLNHLGRSHGPRLWSLVATTRSSAHTLAGGDLIGVAALPTSVVLEILRTRRPGVDPATLEKAAERSAGNPLFALELVALLAAAPDATPVPPSAVELLRQRLRGLPPAQRLIMPLVVTAAARASWVVVRSAAAWVDGAASAEGDLAQALHALAAADLVREVDSRLVPTHPLVGEVSLALLPRTRQAALHDAVAEALQELGDPLPAVAHHRVQAFDLAPSSRRASTAARAADEVARVALAQGRDLEAAAMARCILRAWAASDRDARHELDGLRCDAHLLLGHALALREPAEALAAYENGRRLATDDDTRGRFLVAEGWFHYIHGDLGRASQTYQLGLSLSGASPSTTAALLTHLGWVFAREGIYDRGLELCEQALSMIAPSGDPVVLGTALDRKSMIQAFQGSIDAALLTGDLAYEVAARADDSSLLSAVQSHRANICSRREDWETALRYVDEAVALARVSGDSYVESVAWWTRTDVLSRMGDVTGALAANLSEEKALRITGNQVHLGACARRRRRLLGEDVAIPPAPAGRTP